VLTVELDRLGATAGARVLDLGTGGGRHAYEVLRRGGHVAALDRDLAELRRVAGLVTAMADAGEAGAGGGALVLAGDALRLPFRDGAFDRVIVAEVLEHLPDDEAALAEIVRVVRRGGTVAVTVPRFGPELVNWALSDAYHTVPGGHVRIYRRSQLFSRLRRCGLRPLGSHHAHALHSPYWWLRCLVGVQRADHPLVRAYHRLLVWDLTARHPLTQVPERLLRPLIGKSLVVYLERPAR
jgi:SAM-dependent methyltransferase